MESPIYEVLIVGAGPGGLAAAGALARQAHTAMVLSSGKFRNERAKHMHTVPGWDHADPADFRRKCEADLRARYKSIEFRNTTVTRMKKTPIGFEAVCEDGEVYKAKKLCLATGVEDLIDDEVEGYAECWGRGIYHCLFCHGFEERGVQQAGVLVTCALRDADKLPMIIRMAKNLSHNLTVYTNGHEEFATELKSRIKSSKVTFDTRLISRLSLVDGGPTVRIGFADGSSPAKEGFLTSHPKVRNRAENIITQLGLELTETGDVKISQPFNETSVKGCFAVGDHATPFKSAMQALNQGFMASVGCVFQLQEESEAVDKL